MTHYKISHTMCVQHPHFDAVNFRFGLSPTRETAELLQKNNMLVKAQGTNRWIVIREVKSRDAQPDMPNMSFQLTPDSPNQYFAMGNGPTVLEAGKATVSVRHTGGVWAVLTVPAMPEGDPPCSVTVQLEPVCRYWEFLVFPSQADVEHDRLVVKEERGAIRFGAGEWVDLKGANRRAWRVQTAEALPIRQAYPFRIGLWEVADGMERFCCNLTPPLSTSHSVLQPNTVSSYCYC